MTFTRNLHSEIERIPISYPVKVFFAGFESDTFRLQRAGWQLSMENTIEMCRDGHTVRLAMKHEQARLYALTNRVPLGSRYLAAVTFGETQAVRQFIESVQFDVICVAPAIQFQVIPEMGPMSFQAIDATPQFMDRKTVDLETIGMFKPLALSEDVELYVPEKSVPELLELIRQKQEPIQKELREKKRKAAMREDVRAQMLGDDFSGYKPQRDIRAQILSIAI